MKILGKFLSRLTIARELLIFFWRNKLWWMIPLVALILVLAVLITLAQGAAVVPFIYTLF